MQYFSLAIRRVFCGDCVIVKLKISARVWAVDVCVPQRLKQFERTKEIRKEWTYTNNLKLILTCSKS